MQQQIRKTVLVLLAMGLMFSFQSCKKNDDPILTNTELLTVESGWTIESAEGNIDEIADALIALSFQLLPPEFQTSEMEAQLRAEFELEELVEIEDCDKDNITVFRTNGDIFEQDLGVLCEGLKPTVVNTWAFNTDETKLIINDNQDGEVQNFDIITLNESTLTIELRMVIEEEMDEDDLADLEGLAGYEDFINKELLIRFTFKAN